jgi:hypothetical protein
VTIRFRGQRKGTRVLDLTDDEPERLGGRQIRRLGKRRKLTTRLYASQPRAQQHAKQVELQITDKTELEWIPLLYLSGAGGFSS